MNKVVDLVVLGKCLRQFAQNAKRNAKCLLNPEKAANRYCAESVIRRARVKAVK
jgi:hypothetical protein